MAASTSNSSQQPAQLDELADDVAGLGLARVITAENAAQYWRSLTSFETFGAGV